MSEILAVVMVVSIAGIVLELFYRIVTKDGYVRVLPRVITIAAAGVIAYTLLPRRVEQMGSLDETASIVLCYGSMLLGMTAEYAYSLAERASRGEAKVKFDTLTFLMPIFASPIVFIPLLTLTSEIGAGGGAFTRARVMVYLVAFQNGFFWKQLFEQRRQAATTIRHEPMTTA